MAILSTHGAAHAQDAAAIARNRDPGAVRVRYMVNDVAASVAFYAKLGFKVEGASPYFAALSRGDVQLLLSPVKGPGGASQPMPDGRQPAPGGWNRIVLNTPDIQRDVARLRGEGVHFRNEIVSGLGGKEILLDDPSGNSVELFQPG
ncbi:MAG: VOC family protein [Proteobacteria bacterium]|nr:VOC family protein [Pseudomonadota bacterium]